jgi:predicted glycogen debranching enzyme
MLPSISFSQKILSNFAEAVEKEWIITNGLGGYSSSTVLGINTRKYHGLLVTGFHPPRYRRICIEKLDEEILAGNNIYPLGANEFQNGIFPQGHLFLTEFSVSPFPRFVYVVQDVEVQKTILMPYEKNAVITVYSILNKSGFDVKTRVFPLINWRHIHSVTDRWKNPWELVQTQEDKEVCVRFSVPQSVLMMKTTSGQYNVAGRWNEKVFYREEAMRGESCFDDYYQLGYFEVGVESNKNENFAIIAVADKNETDAVKALAEMPATLYDIEALQEREMKRREDLLAKFYEKHKSISINDWLNWIVLATDTFITKKIDDLQKFVIAGYHWFETWGRDAFISLPGLMLVTGRFEDARKVLLTFKKHCKQGLIPNFIPDQLGQPAYNTVDATLWFMNAVLQYLKYTNDFKFVQERLWEALKTIIEDHVKGTAFEIHVDNDCLLSHGSQLTWMDATVDGQPMTPRAGKAVEVQALWYNTLKTMELLANRFKEKSEAEKYLQTAEKARENFVRKFWNPQKNCLFDVVTENSKDESLRPNQIITVALDFTMLDNVKSEKIVDLVYHELLTGYGLRSLAKSDSRYIGIYAGDRRSRDKAYHNGTVWPWLLGPFTTAFLKTKGHTEFRREYALKNFLLPLFAEQILEAGLGTISEIFDGDPPHMPRGCISQAWSIAEPLRAYVEDVMQIRPRYEKEVFLGM